MPQGSSCSEAKPERQQQEAGGTPGSGLPGGALTAWQSRQESLLPAPRPRLSEGGRWKGRCLCTEHQSAWLLPSEKAKRQWKCKLFSSRGNHSFLEQEGAMRGNYLLWQIGGTDPEQGGYWQSGLKAGLRPPSCTACLSTTS